MISWKDGAPLRSVAMLSPLMRVGNPAADRFVWCGANIAAGRLRVKDRALRARCVRAAPAGPSPRFPGETRQHGYD